MPAHIQSVYAEAENLTMQFKLSTLWPFRTVPEILHFFPLFGADMFFSLFLMRTSLLKSYRYSDILRVRCNICV